MTVIIDYGAGNIKSVEKALLSCGQEVVSTDDADTILSADRNISVSYDTLMLETSFAGDLSGEGGGFRSRHGT